MMPQPFRLERNQANSQQIYEPAEEAPAPATGPAVSPEVEREVLAILDAPRADGELTSDAFRKKEHALGTVFAALSAAEALALHRRFVLAGADDDLARKFSRLVIERRQRLLGFLCEVRRRAAGTR